MHILVHQDQQTRSINTILNKHWDPLNMVSLGVQDEYLSYAQIISRMAYKGNISYHILVSSLSDLAIRQMEIAPDHTAIRRTANAIMAFTSYRPA